MAGPHEYDPSQRPGPSHARDRRHLRPARPYRINPRFTRTELADIRRAASAVGMTPTGYLAEAGLAAARDTQSAALDPARESLARLQAELFDARTAVGRVTVALDHAVTALRGTGGTPIMLVDAVRACEQRMVALDAVIEAMDRALR